MARILGKLDVRDRVQALLLAYEIGLVRRHRRRGDERRCVGCFAARRGATMATLHILVGSTSAFDGDVLVTTLRSAGFDVPDCIHGHAEDLFPALEQRLPDVLVVSASTAAPLLLEAPANARELRARWPDLRVALIADRIDVRSAVELLDPAPTATALLLRQQLQGAHVLVDAVERLMRGEAVIDPVLVAQLMRRDVGELSRLTAGEREALALMAEGRSNSGIARQLLVSRHTVEKRVSSIFDKLSIRQGVDDNRRVLAVLRYLGDAGAVTSRRRGLIASTLRPGVGKAVSDDTAIRLVWRSSATDIHLAVALVTHRSTGPRDPARGGSPRRLRFDPIRPRGTPRNEEALPDPRRARRRGRRCSSGRPRCRSARGTVATGPAGVHVVADASLRGPGYGYDVANSAYFNTGGVKTSPILDIGKLEADGLIKTQPQSDFDQTIHVGSNITEYSRSLSSSVGVSGGIGAFKASVKSSFGTFSKVAAETSFITNDAVSRKREYWIHGGSNVATLTPVPVGRLQA